MRNFKVLVISHSLKQNKIAKSGDVVSESQLTCPASELIEAGFIKEVFGVEDVQTKEAEEAITLIPADIEEKEVFDVKKEIKDIKKPFQKK
jgi:hypothetical protein